MSGANRPPSVLARYFHHRHLVSPEHAEMVTDAMMEGKGLARRGAGQDDEAGRGGITAVSASGSASSCFSN